MTTPITAEVVGAALAVIPADLPRDEWAKVGAAIKSEFSDDTGRALFDQWSATGAGYSSKAVASTWRSLKASGGITIATLLGMAKERGFVLPKPNHAAPKPDPATVTRLAGERKARQQAEQAQERAAHERGAIEAGKLWDSASETGESGYLTRKGVQPYGVRFLAGGWLLVPMRDAAGVLWNVQRVAPQKKEGGNDKWYGVKGGSGSRKTGLWHWCGDPVGAAVLLIAEGYATAASLHQATGLPVAVAFDVGNLASVAKALRNQYPGALLVVCGDDDLQTFAEKGFNPGRDKATAAARAVCGLAVFPEGGSDFNDLHQAAGLDAVRAIVGAAIDGHAAHQAGAGAAKSRGAGNGRGGNGNARPGADSEAAPAHDWDRYFVTDAGVFYEGIDAEGNKKPPVWVCSRLDVEARTRDQDGGGWGYLLTFADPLGNAKQWAMPARMLSGDGGEYRATLLGMGLLISSTPAARNLLTQFIQTRRPDEFASCTDRIGWHNGAAFVLPHETIGDDAERIVFQTDNAVENTFRTKGTAQQWRDRVGALCVGNSRLVFAVACAFAGPTLRPAGMESGGFHFRGDSSSGKTTALKVAASVYGGASFLQRWRTTDNALEAIAAQHSDCLLILDELAQVDPKTAGECAYMLANEQSKARATRTGAPRTRLSWRLLFLSAGELGLADHMAEGMKRTRTGQEVRMADIQADAGVGLGAFENLHGHDGGSAFSRHITDRAASVYGAPGHEWLQWLCANAQTLKARIRGDATRLGAEMVPTGASGQVERVAARFALVGAAGELATEAGLTGWSAGESERAALACFNAWLAARGGAGNGEVAAMLRQVRRFLESHGDGRFPFWHRGADDHAPKTLQRAGVRRMVGADGVPIKTNSQYAAEFGDGRMPAALGEEISFEYFVLAETFKSEVCQGFDAQAVARVLLDHGCLIPDKGRTFDCKPRLPGIGPSRCYRIAPAIFELDV